MKRDFSERILVSITGKKKSDWKNKLKEINRLNIKKIALFLETFNKKNRDNLYIALSNSEVKEIPLVHIRNNMSRQEIKFLYKRFKSRYFTIHEDSFNYLKKWNGFHKNLYLEFNYDNIIPKNVKINRIGGFCVDLSHFKASEERFGKEFQYELKRKNIHRYFKCNHLNGYSYKTNEDLHTIKSLRDFDYLKTLPRFLFSNYIGIEVSNSIKEQLKFKKYLIKFLSSNIK
ncbi:MAG: hypothetical protein V1663_04005 [archaeon]